MLRQDARGNINQTPDPEPDPNPHRFIPDQDPIPGLV